MNADAVLAQTRIQGITDELLDVRTLPDSQIWNRRVPDENAEDAEIMARYTGRALIAPLIADDAEAPTHAADPVRLTQTKVPNIKHGRVVGQRQLELLRRVIAGQATARERNSLDEYFADQIMKNVMGIDQRKEALKAAMVADELDYDQFGIKIENLSWGMPSALKQAASTAWTDAANATPISDLLGIKRTARETYGVTLDRVTMSSLAYDRMIATTEYQNKAKNVSAPYIISGQLPAGDDEFAHKQIIARLLGMEVEISDWQFRQENADGSISMGRFIPEAAVILTSKSLDGDISAWDFANGIITESTVAEFVGGVYGDFGGETRGPASWVEGDMNPPALTIWSAARGFPRKHYEVASARLTAWS